MRDLNDLYYFVQVVDNGGFAAAGRALGIQKSKLSRCILQLEERLGVRLLNRSSRRFSVTESGREFYDRCVAMLVEAEAAEHTIAAMRAEPSGVIRIGCPVALVASQFGGLIARFMVENPAVEVHLESTNRPHRPDRRRVRRRDPGAVPTARANRSRDAQARREHAVPGGKLGLGRHAETTNGGWRDRTGRPPRCRTILGLQRTTWQRCARQRLPGWASCSCRR
jgi:DNA-binding transcriptional LysR family regulator